MGLDEVDKRKAEVRVHLESCLKLYWIQHRAGRYFLREHPHGASSWHEELVRELQEQHGVLRVLGDRCRFGLTAVDQDGEGPAMKPTGFLTNSACVAVELDRRCPSLDYGKGFSRGPRNDDPLPRRKLH